MEKSELSIELLAAILMLLQEGSSRDHFADIPPPKHDFPNPKDLQKEFDLAGSDLEPWRELARKTIAALAPTNVVVMSEEDAKLYADAREKDRERRAREWDE